MNINKIKTKIFAGFLLVNLILWNSAGSALALFGGGPSVPSPEEVMDKVEKHYGFDGNILRRSKAKGDYPKVELFFNKTSPKPGEKVTATAMPQYFKNISENLYYTWFLFREGDDLSDSDAMEEAKIRAMGMVARGDFDPQLFGTDYTENKNDDPDKDGFDASYGGGDGVGGKDVDKNNDFLGQYESYAYIDPVQKEIVDSDKITRCYKHNFGYSDPESYSGAGQDVIVECEHEFPEAPKGEKFKNPLNENEMLECRDDYEVGDGEFPTKEELCWKLDPNNPDTDGDGVQDEADLAGLGQNQFTWNFQPGDRVGVFIEGTSMVVVNEDGSEQQNLPNIITFNCSGFSDNTYCIGSNGVIGDCQDEECVNYSCTGDNLDEDSPCQPNSSWKTGICQGGECVRTSDCMESSDGELCDYVKNGGENIAGICFLSECVKSKCVNSTDNGTKCQTDNGNVGVCNAEGDCEESFFSDVVLNPYYKIMWAGIDRCDNQIIDGVENKDKKDLIRKDKCDGSGDYGYTYLATKSVFEKKDSLLKSNLTFSPQSPQADKNYDYSDYITVKAGFNQSEINDSFIYYDWDVYYCSEEEIRNETCTQKTSLTDSCGENAVLGDCANNLESNSSAEGMGVNQIKFRGSDNFYDSRDEDEEKFYFKVFLKTKRSKDSNSMGLSSVDIPVTKNKEGIVFLKIKKTGASFPGDEICTTGVYKKICPVYSGQILAAAYNKSDDVEAFSWEVNGQRVENKKGVINNWDPTSYYSDYVLLPIIGSEMELQTITLKVKKVGGEEITTERVVSIAKPMTRVVSNDLNKIWPWVVDDGTENGKISEKVLVGKIGEKVSLKADIIPSYLNNEIAENNVDVTWFINEKEVDANFIAKNSDSEIVVNGQNIEFKLIGGEGDSLSLGVKVSKKFSDEERATLSSNWGLKDFDEYTTRRDLTVKLTSDDSLGGVAQRNSMVAFMASTFQNAPEYFIFIIRTAIVLVLFGSFLYGFNYWFDREVKLEK